MKLITTLSITAIVSIVSVSAYASAKDAFQARFHILHQLSQSSQYTFDVFNENPWCGYKGAPGNPPTPGATYPDFRTGKIATNKPPTMVELNWLKGLKSASDPKAYVDAHQGDVSYKIMEESLKEGSLHCAARVVSNEKSKAAPKLIMRQKYASSVLDSASIDCKNYPAYETQLKNEADDLKHDADKFKDKTCPECFPVEGNKLKDREKDLNKKKETAGIMFQNCVSNYSQLFVNPTSIYGKQ